MKYFGKTTLKTAFIYFNIFMILMKYEILDIS